MALLLFIDDEPDTLKTLEKAVQLLGHQALLAHNARQAYKLLDRYKPDLIFVDLQLGDIDGLNVVRMLRAPANPAERVPVVILSASPEVDVAARARQSGAQDYLLKPLRLQTLLETIEKFVPPMLVD